MASSFGTPVSNPTFASFGRSDTSFSFGAGGSSTTQFPSGSTTTTTGSATPAPPALTFGASSTPAPPPPAFGAAPSPARTAFNFNAPSTVTGATPPAFGAQASSTGAFGAPPSFTGAFGAQASSTTTAFGAPTSSNLFGSPASSNFFVAPTPATNPFGAAPGATSPYGATAPPPQPLITGQTMYADLPPEWKRAFDSIYEQMMRNKRILADVECMAPEMLREPPAAADEAAGDRPTASLVTQLQDVRRQFESLEKAMGQSRDRALQLKRQYETSTTQSVLHGIWPMEAVALRQGVKLSKTKQFQSITAPPPGAPLTAEKQARQDMDKLLREQVKQVDRVERFPSPYMWEVLDDLQRRFQDLRGNIALLQSELDAASRLNNDEVDLASIVQSQGDAITRLIYAVDKLHEDMNQLRDLYNRWTTPGQNVLQKAREQELLRQQSMENQVRAQVLRTSPAAGNSSSSSTQPPPATTLGALNTTPSFGTSTNTAGGLFAAKAPAAPAPSTAGGLFGTGGTAGGTSGTPAPAPSSSGGLFGSSGTPAPAPPAAGLFGTTNTPAPAQAPTATVAPAGAAPATGAGLFGSTNTPAPAQAPTTTAAPGTTPAAAAPGTPAPTLGAGHGFSGGLLGPSASTAQTGGGHGQFSNAVSAPAFSSLGTSSSSSRGSSSKSNKSRSRNRS